MKTFVAPCIGGVKNGKLMLAIKDTEQFVIPILDDQRNICYQIYNLQTDADGSRSWICRAEVKV